MRAKSSGTVGREEDIDTLAETLCSHVKELYSYNEEIEKRRSSLTDIEKEITDLEQKARHVTDSINKLQARIQLEN
jgi:phage shock protein A